MKDNRNNTGVGNTGYGNSGNWNSGNWNSGYGNSGDWNSGNWNSGYGNSGNRNSGNWNSGNWNSGNSNSGNGNSTDRESGIFCSQEGTVRCFNKYSGKKWDEIDHPNFYEFYLTKWIDESEMTDEEKKNDPEFYIRGGYLKEYSYKEAWANYWRDTNEKDRQRVLNLPNFDAKVFKEITGIDVEESGTKKQELLDKADELVKKAEELRKSAGEL